MAHYKYGSFEHWLFLFMSYIWGRHKKQERALKNAPASHKTFECDPRWEGRIENCVKIKQKSFVVIPFLCSLRRHIRSLQSFACNAEMHPHTVHWDTQVQTSFSVIGVALTRKKCVFYTKKEQATQIWKCRAFTVRKKAVTSHIKMCLVFSFFAPCREGL